MDTCGRSCSIPISTWTHPDASCPGERLSGQPAPGRQLRLREGKAAITFVASIMQMSTSIAAAGFVAHRTPGRQPTVQLPEMMMMMMSRPGLARARGADLPPQQKLCS